MAIVQWDPFLEMADMRDRFDGPFGELYGGSLNNVVSGGSWLPPVDIYTNDNREFVIVAELPDVRRDDIEVTVESGTLTLRGNKSMDREIREEQFHRVERSYGAFRRSFALPSTVDPAKVEAEYRNGVLVVRLQLRDETKPRQIAIQESA